MQPRPQTMTVDDGHTVVIDNRGIKRFALAAPQDNSALDGQFFRTDEPLQVRYLAFKGFHGGDNPSVGVGKRPPVATPLCLEDQHTAWPEQNVIDISESEDRSVDEPPTMVAC